MLKHQNREELTDDEVKEGEILPPSRDPDQFSGSNRSRDFRQRRSRGLGADVEFRAHRHVFYSGLPARIDGLDRFRFTDFPSVSEIARWTLRMEPAETVSAAPKESDGRSFLGRGAYSLFSWDPDTAITLPDGQKVAVRLSELHREAIMTK
mgnify:CR=1 FL=1